jgi:hypothetical protein
MFVRVKVKIKVYRPNQINRKVNHWKLKEISSTEFKLLKNESNF